MSFSNGACASDSFMALLVVDGSLAGDSLGVRPVDKIRPIATGAAVSGSGGISKSRCHSMR